MSTATITAPAAGSAWFCEVRPYLTGNCYQIESRQRVLAWRVEKGRTLPITAHGPVDFRAFMPNSRAPANGMAMVELRDGPTSERRWWSPLFDREIDDRKLKQIMRHLAEKARGATAAAAEEGAS
jgi:hypothetical protein